MLVSILWEYLFEGNSKNVQLYMHKSHRLEAQNDFKIKVYFKSIKVSQYMQNLKQLINRNT